MSKKNESLGKTVGVVLALCLVCSIVVSGAAIGLKPMQERNAALAMQENILDAAGILEKGMDVPAHVMHIQRGVDRTVVHMLTTPIAGATLLHGMHSAAPLCSTGRPLTSGVART